MRSIGVIGNVNVDLLAWPVESIPPPGTEQSIDRIDTRLGGAAGIAAAALARLGARPVLAGCVGNDDLGRLTLNELERYGVDTARVRRVDGAATGVSIGFESGRRDRSFLISLGSLKQFDETMVDEAALACDLVLFCGYFNLPSLRGDGLRALLEQVHGHGGMTLLDTGWDHDGWLQTTREEVLDVLKGVDVFLPNGAEASALSDVGDPRSAAHALRWRVGRAVIVKLGAAGCLGVGVEDEEVRVSAPAVTVRDTTGAGDCFNAGLLAALVDGEDWTEACRFAVRLASTVVSRPSGARYPTIADVVDLA